MWWLRRCQQGYLSSEAVGIAGRRFQEYIVGRQIAMYNAPPMQKRLCRSIRAHMLQCHM